MRSKSWDPNLPDSAPESFFCWIDVGIVFGIFVWHLFGHLLILFGLFVERLFDTFLDPSFQIWVWYFLWLCLLFQSVDPEQKHCNWRKPVAISNVSCNWRYHAFLEASGGIWRYLEVSGGFWRYLAVSGRYLVVSGGIWRYLTWSSGIWRHLRAKRAKRAKRRKDTTRSYERLGQQRHAAVCGDMCRQAVHTSRSLIRQVLERADFVCIIFVYFFEPVFECLFGLIWG